MLSAIQQQAEMAGYVDADLATPIPEVLRLLQVFEGVRPQGVPLLPWADQAESKRAVLDLLRAVMDLAYLTAARRGAA